MDFAGQNGWVIVLVLALVALIAAWMLLVNRKARVELKTFDALEEGAGPAKRNQALIDAPAKPEAAPAPALAAAPEGADDLTRIKGLGPRIATLLHSLGVTRFAEIAAWSEEDIDRIDAQLGAFEGRIRRDNWVEQARFLAVRDEAGFEGKFGRL